MAAPAQPPRYSRPLDELLNTSATCSLPDSPQYEYRVVGSDGGQRILLDYPPTSTASKWDRAFPETAPHRVERRLIGEWEPVEATDD